MYIVLPSIRYLPSIPMDTPIACKTHCGVGSLELRLSEEIPVRISERRRTCRQVKTVWQYLIS